MSMEDMNDTSFQCGRLGKRRIPMLEDECDLIFLGQNSVRSYIFLCWNIRYMETLYFDTGRTMDPDIFILEDECDLAYSCQNMRKTQQFNVGDE